MKGLEDIKEKEACFYKKLKNKTVQCRLCPRYCVLKPGKWGNCNARKNIDGKLYSMVYGKAVSLAIDPIEKKPLFHFLPGSSALSIATAGCNFHCEFCQNWQISQVRPESVPYFSIMPKDVVNKALELKTIIISYTYTEPTIFYEYMFDIAKIAKQHKIKSVMISNGFINQQPLAELIPFLDAANIDFKGPEKIYKKLCSAWRKPVEETIIRLREKKVWLELTNLIIPGYNDKEKEIRAIVNWIKENLGCDVPLHFSAFYPAYKMSYIKETNPKIVLKARKIALNSGLNYVYCGNILDEESSTTYCPNCKKALIRRKSFFVIENKIKKGKKGEGKCPYCNEKIAGVW
mgnify:CR=1 FL=1